MIRCTLRVRWKSGAVDSFRLSERSYSFLNGVDRDGTSELHRALIARRLVQAVDHNGCVFSLHLGEAAAARLLLRNSNPLEDDDHYEDPLS